MSTETELSTADVLRRAKQLIETHGWTKGKNFDPATGSFCAVGAIREASQTYLSGTVAIKATKAAVGLDGDPLYVWNDAQESVEPVLAAFDRTIALAEGGAR